MDEEIDQLVVSVRADTSALSRDVAAMRGTLEGELGTGADRAGRAIERGLLRAVRTGKFGFEDLGRVALSVLSEIAAAAVQSDLGSLGFGLGGSGGGGGLLSLGTSLIGSLLGSPGRATGGPVAPGRAYRVGERGPEWFVPTASGQVVTGEGAGGGRSVNVAIRIDGGGSDKPQALARSARQVARAVRGALE
jgi:phage-related minor tail protein